MGDSNKKSSPKVKVPVNQTSPNNTVKILNDRASKRSKPASTESSPPLKHVKLSIGKSKITVESNDDMDHYVLKTIKDEASLEGGETIAFVLNEEPKDVTSAAGEVAEELQISEEEADDTDGKTDVMEHVCGKCYKTFRRFSVSR